MADLGTLGGIRSQANGINGAGTIVGQSWTTGGADHAFSFSAGEMADLAPYLAGIGLTGDSSACAINERGDIVGYAATAAGYTHAFLLVVPEPSTVALLALGGGGTGAPSPRGLLV